MTRTRQIPEALRSLPLDERRAGAKARARFQYQDDVAALTALQHLRRDDLEGIALEHITDFILFTKSGAPKLVSVKHREPHQTGDVAWSWSELGKQSVLTELHAAWRATDRRCSIAFYTNAGYAREASRFWSAAGRPDPPAEVVERVAKQLGVSANEAAEFLRVLDLGERPLPDRVEIRDHGVRRVADLLASHDRSSAAAESSYKALRQAIERLGRADSAMEAGVIPRRDPQLALEERYISADEIAELILSVHDRRVAPTQLGRRWEPDPLFQGRTEELAAVEAALQPGALDPVTPVVLRGMPGTGKTALALQFAALHSLKLRPLLVDGSSRSSLTAGLATLAETPEWPADLDTLSGPVAPTLPGTSATLLIIDGVPDRTVIEGLIPRRNLCRVILTTPGHLDDAFTQLKLGPWRPAESRGYIQSVSPKINAADADALSLAVDQHPLAIVQAVNLCKRSGTSIKVYLEDLAKTPLVTLDTGVAAGHPRSVTQVIRHSLDAAAAQDPDALDLLGVIAFLVRAPESLFDIKPGVIASLDPRTPPKTHLRSLSVRKLLSDRGRRHQPPRTHPRSLSIRKLLSDRGRRRQVLVLLTDLSLVELQGGDLAVHPLTRLVLAANMSDIRPWMEVALGLFVPRAAQEDVAPNDLAANAPTLVRLADECLKRDLFGMGLFGLLLLLAPSLAAMGDPANALRYAQAAHDWARSLKGDPYGVTAKAQLVYAHVLVWNGDVDRAVEVYEETAWEASARGDGETAMAAMVALSLAVVQVSRMDLVTRCLELVTVDVDPAKWGMREQTLIHFARARLLWKLSRTGAARRELEAALTMAAVVEHPPDLEGLVLEAAAEFAQHGEWGEDLVSVEEKRVSIMRRVEGPLSREYVRALASLADAYAGVYRLDRAAELLEEAEGVVRSEFGNDIQLRTDILRILGRLDLHGARAGGGSQYLEQALARLSEAVDAQRGTGPLHRRGLATALFNLAQVYLDRGEIDRAVSCAAEAYELDLEQFGADHPETRLDKTELERLIAARDAKLAARADT